MIWQQVKDRVQKHMPSAPEALVEGETEVPSDTSDPIRFGYRVLGFGLGAFLLWGAFAPLDEGVPAGASVMLDTKRKAVQHPLGGIVNQVLVKEGQMVKEGDPLIRLDDASSRANYESVKQHYLAIRALESRLLSEKRGAKTVQFHPDLLAAKDDLFVKQHMDNQESLYQARRRAIEADLQGLREAALGQESSQKSYQEMLPHRQNQLRSLQEELVGIKGLVAEGYAPRSKQLELERQVADISASISDLEGNTGRSARGIAELKMRLVSRQQEYLKEVDGQLAEVRREVEADAEKLRAMSGEMDRTEIKAPAAGQVVGLTVQTVGGVIQGAQKIMDIVPDNETLLLEAHIPPHVIDRVKVDQEVDIRFSSFAHSPQLVVEGKLVSISGDLVQDPNPQIPPYYLGRAMVTEAGMKTLGKRVMHPGMPAEVVIKTGRRSMLTYLLHPLTKRIAASMTEE